MMKIELLMDEVLEIWSGQQLFKLYPYIDDDGKSKLSLEELDVDDDWKKVS